jgi:IclR family acetate operon transcriptional repressor
MRDLMLQSEESVHLAVLVEDEAMYVDTEQGKGIFSVATQIGGKAPLHSSAVGKSLLAELPNEEVNRLLANKGLRRFTERTLVDMQQLHQHLARTREQGCAIDDEETYLGVRCVAATIHDHRGTMVASVGLSGPSQRITDDRLPVLAHLVKEAAAKVSRQLGFVRERPQAAAAAPSLEDPRYVGHCQAGSSAEDH